MQAICPKPPKRLEPSITNANNCIPGSGIYYIAISRFNRDARDCDGNAIWTGIANACAAAGRSRVASWTGSTSACTYQIVLQGAFTAPLGADPADCPPALPREFTLTAGDATFTLRGIRGERITSAGGLGDYKSLGGTAPDHMFQNWWWYRTGTDTREFALSNLTAFEQPQANTVSLTYEESGLIPIAEPKFINPSASNPPSPRPSPPLTRGERAGSGGILHAQQFVNFDGAIGITHISPSHTLREGEVS